MILNCFVNFNLCVLCIFFLCAGFLKKGAFAASADIQYSNAQDVVLQLKHTMGRAKVAAEHNPIRTDEALKYIKQMHVILKNWGDYIKGERDGVNADGSKREKKQQQKDELIDVSINVTYVPEGCTRVTVEGSKVKVHYVGKRLRDNKVFDSSFHTGSMPYRFTIGGNDAKVDGWNEGVLGMCKGERRHILLPYTKGYGEKGSNSVPPYSNLKYTIELVEFSGPSGSRDPAPSNEKKDVRKEVNGETADEPKAPESSATKKEEEERRRRRKRKTATAIFRNMPKFNLYLPPCCRILT